VADDELVIEKGDLVVAAVRQGSEASLRVFLATEDAP
jgi:hypothetical protein